MPKDKIVRVESPPYRCPTCHDKPMIVDGRVFSCCEHLFASEETGHGIVLCYSSTPVK